MILARFLNSKRGNVGHIIYSMRYYQISINDNLGLKSESSFVFQAA